MQQWETVEYSIESGVAVITLNRAEALNAFNARLRHDLRSAVEHANGDETAKVVIITGAGRGFCSGADLADVPANGLNIEQRLNEESKPILLGIAEAEKPYIAAVNGVAAGIGCALVLACDLVVMHETAYFYQAFSGVGLIPDGGITRHLARQIGPKRAYEMIALGQKLPATECLSLGLVNSVAKENALAEAKVLAQQLLSRAPLSLRYAKKALREAADVSLDEAISIEARYQLILSETEDNAEGKRAFLEKRAPQWQGK